MAKINLFSLCVPAYWNLVRYFIAILNGNPKNIKIPTKFTIGGSRKGGKTRVAMIIFAILYALAFPKSMIVIAVEKGGQKPDVQGQVRDFMDNLLMVRAKVSKDIEDNIFFKNGSSIQFRSLKQSGSQAIALKGLIRPVGLKKAVIINEECNSWKKKWFTVVSEAIVAEEILQFNLFNTDHIKQHIVSVLQKHLPENEAVMRKVGNMISVKHVEGELQYFQRTNTIVTWDVLPEAAKLRIVADDLADPVRGRVARWGLNGRDGKILYYNIKSRHFIHSGKTKYERFYYLPMQLFRKYRIGNDTGEQNDKFALTFWGITYHNRAIRLGKMTVTPPENGELDVMELASGALVQILNWKEIYPDMVSKIVNIRIEWAGNGTAVRQELQRGLQKTRINYTIDKAKKSISGKTKKQVGSTKQTQPELEARAAIKNLLLGKNQILFWNPDTETENEYTGRARNEDGLITDGNDHEGDADDYALIPEYTHMIDNPPKITFAQELDECIEKYNL